ncbi:acetate kinase [uncultured Clostridium sp.]|uniref:acetate kinase n=1 Tax=uncultured Clostridium sp. TaxID=59620 RepID=UPI0028E5A335|nr:acetate kinase [uncultured Clostridium sp.]
MKVLVINCGSSSLKYQLIDMSTEEALAQGLVERIGINGSILTQKVDGKDKYVIETPLKDHQDAIELVLKSLVDDTHGVIKSMDEISAVGHRVVHGGKYATSVVVSDEVIEYLHEIVKLAPLHNPGSISGIRACQAIMKNTPMVLVFDTAFHQTMPQKAFMYPVPYKFYEEDGVRRYGFHGTSHKYVAGEVAKVLNKDVTDLKTITCHIGNGVSITAVNGGESVDTTMGFTPLDGIMMGSRSGSIDPSIVTYLMQEKGYSAAEMDKILNKESGILGLSGIGTDFRDIRSGVEERNDPKALLVMDIMGYQVKKQIGAYAAAMGGVDAIVFTAGVGEHAPEIRIRALTDMEFLGIKLNVKQNESHDIGDGMEISTPDSKVKVYVIPTNEELMIAKETMVLV